MSQPGHLLFCKVRKDSVLLSQVSSNLNSHNLYNSFQSLYHPGHNTEIALLKVVGKGNMSVLALLDYYSAFYTIDHTILVHHLHTDFRFTDAVLQWFSSYLTDRTHYVSYLIVLLLLLNTQVSVLGPILFAIYIKPLSAILTHSLSCTIHLLMTYNYRCLLPLMKYLSYFTLCSHI